MTCRTSRLSPKNIPPPPASAPCRKQASRSAPSAHAQRMVLAACVVWQPGWFACTVAGTHSVRVNSNIDSTSTIPYSTVLQVLVSSHQRDTNVILILSILSHILHISIVLQYCNIEGIDRPIWVALDGVSIIINNMIMSISIYGYHPFHYRLSYDRYHNIDITISRVYRDIFVKHDTDIDSTMVNYQ